MAFFLPGFRTLPLCPPTAEAEGATAALTGTIAINFNILSLRHH